jgi:sec-independent protein translocase protein TatA
MFGVNSTELLIIMLVLVLLFGASRIPELGKSLGRGIKEFKTGLRAIEEDDTESQADQNKKKIKQSEDV